MIKVSLLAIIAAVLCGAALSAEDGGAPNLRSSKLSKDPSAAARKLVAATGACCSLGGLNCQLTTEFDCTSAGRDYQGDGTDCSVCTSPPPDTGVCCLPLELEEGPCSIRAKESCASSGGVFLDGEEGTCESNPCAGVCVGEGCNGKS